jgi:predicted glutamate--cysteine ligase
MSAANLLLKGLEEEVYTGTPDGTVIGMSHLAKKNLENFTTEPDCRNTEFISPPLRDYDEIGCTLMRLRRRLRDWLITQGDYTLIPGATLSTGDSSVFHISDPDNAYYRYIRDTYFTRVVTASAHISIGLDDTETIMRASRLLRMEASLFLALSAASPFLDGRPTGRHSQRWTQFPHTPSYVPLFESHAHYCRFIHDSIAAGTMQNTRHLWISARPNGPAVPEQINRIELRICDQTADPQRLVALTALLEARIWMLLDDPALDPLTASQLPAATRLDDLMEINDFNNTAVMTGSLDAAVRHWRDGRKMAVRDWLEEFYAQAQLAARQRGFCSYLSPIRDILATGNTAQHWLAQHEQGVSVRDILRRAIIEMAEAEVEHAARVC